MQAVILAAGVGSRLEGVSQGLPKCLIPIGDRPLIDHQLETLADADIGPILIVIGYKGDKVREMVGNRAEYVENPRFEETNSLYSLWAARDWVKGPFLLINSDILFHPDILDRLVTKEGNALAFDASSTAGKEQTKVFVRDGRVWDLGKDLPPELARGESLGMICFDSEGSKALFSRVDAIVRNGGEKSWVMEAVRSMCNAVPVRAVNVTGLPWAEVDFPFDLDRARKEVLPAILRTKWKRTTHWRWTRWVAVAFAALLLVVAGILISSNLQTQDIAWSTMPPTGSSEVLLSLPKGTQKWWVTSRAQPLRVYVDGPSSIQVDFRLVVSQGLQLPGQYVVQVSLDGKPNVWDVFKATEDSEANISGLIVGDRDRSNFESPTGRHVIEVSLLAGTSDSMLVRVRRAEPASPEDEESE